MRTENELAVIRGHEELYARTGHLFQAATTEISCAANDYYTWVTLKDGMAARPPMPRDRPALLTVRKLYRPGVLLDPVATQQMRTAAAHGAQVRFIADELNETIIIDRRVVILAGDTAHGPRSFSVVWASDVVQAVCSLFDAAWRTSTELEVYDREMVEIRRLAPRILELLGSGCKDDTAARTLSLSVRTYRRRVAELMSALGASSRFQAGVRARELGLV
ncbi:MAG: DNA-binding response regulator [Labedaea sp.]